MTPNVQSPAASAAREPRDLGQRGRAEQGARLQIFCATKTLESEEWVQVLLRWKLHHFPVENLDEMLE